MKKQNRFQSIWVILVPSIILLIGISIAAKSAQASTRSSATDSLAQQLAKLPASCPETALHFTTITPGIGVNLGTATSGEQIKGGETGIATGEINGAYTYSIMVGTISYPATLQGYGFISVSDIPADSCQYNRLAAAGTAPKIPSTSLLDISLPTGITITGISGNILSFQETTGKAGQFNYVTGTYLSK